MFIEIYVPDFKVWGDGEKATAKIDLAASPFGFQFPHSNYPDKIAAFSVEGDPETLTQMECSNSGSYVTITFPSVKPGGEFWTVRLRGKYIVS